MAYFGFKREKNIDKSIIDWSSITKKISDDILSVKADRDKQRNEIENTQLEQLKKVSDYTNGVDTTMNTFVMTQSQSTRDFLSSIHKQMKDGIISVDQAKRVKQSVMDTWDNVSVASKTFQENAKRLGEAKGKSNEALLKIMGLNADLNDKKIVYDPENGQGFYVDINKETGEVDMDTAKPVQAINAVQNQTKTYVDVAAETAALAKNAPKIQLAKSGITSITDALQSKNYTDYLNNVVNSKISNNERAASVLLDYLNMEYAIDGEKGENTFVTYNKITGFTENGEAIEEPTTIEVGPIRFNSSTGKAELTDKQLKIAKEAYKNAVMGQLSRVKTQQYVPEKTGGASGASRRNKNLSLYELSMGIAMGSKQSIKSLKGQTYTTVGEDNKKTQFVLGEPTFTPEYIQINDANGNRIETIARVGSDGKPLPEREVALQIAPFIRSGEASDTILSSFGEGEKVYGGEFKITGELATVKETETYLDSLPTDYTEATEYLEKAYEGDDRISFDTNWQFGRTPNKVKVIIQTPGGPEAESFDPKTEKEKIKTFIESYGLKIPRKLVGEGLATKVEKEKLTVAQIKAQNPKMTSAEAIAFYKAQ